MKLNPCITLVHAISDLGRQPDLLTYQAGRGEFPAPVPDELQTLFAGIREKAPELRTLHIDNINPGTISRHPEESIEALSVITRYHTPGDVAAFGMETADPEVVAVNNLKAGPEEVLEAVRIVNSVGARRSSGIPELLPGLNFISGLPGETRETFEHNMQFLREDFTEPLPYPAGECEAAHAIPRDQGVRT